MFGGKLRIDTVEPSDVFGPQVGRCIHPREQHGQIVLFEFCQHRPQVGPRDGRIDTAQTVISAELENHCIGIVRQRPVQAGQSAGRSIAGHPGVYNVDCETLAAQRGLQLGGETVGFARTLASRQAVAQSEDADRAGATVPADRTQLTAPPAAA